VKIIIRLFLITLVASSSLFSEVGLTPEGSSYKTLIDSLIKTIGFNPQKIGITIYSIDAGKFIFTHNGEKPLIPASNQKLLISACGLSLWNKEFPKRLARHLKGRRSTRRRYVLSRLNAKSDNLLAEALFRTIGEYKGTRPEMVIRRYLKTSNISTSGLIIADGSGRSRKNRVTTKTLVELLNHLYFSPLRRDFLGSLAVAGKRGTLRRRLFSLKNRVYAKTGYIRNVYALSGYLFTNNSVYSFSIIINHPPNKNFTHWEFIERLLSLLAHHS